MREKKSKRNKRREKQENSQTRHARYRSTFGSYFKIKAHSLSFWVRKSFDAFRNAMQLIASVCTVK